MLLRTITNFIRDVHCIDIKFVYRSEPNKRNIYTCPGALHCILFKKQTHTHTHTHKQNKTKVRCCSNITTQRTKIEFNLVRHR